MAGGYTIDWHGADPAEVITGSKLTPGATPGDERKAKETKAAMTKAGAEREDKLTGGSTLGKMQLDIDRDASKEFGPRGKALVETGAVEEARAAVRRGRGRGPAETGVVSAVDGATLGLLPKAKSAMTAIMNPRRPQKPFKDNYDAEQALWELELDTARDTNPTSATVGDISSFALAPESVLGRAPKAGGLIESAVGLGARAAGAAAPPAAKALEVAARTGVVKKAVQRTTNLKTLKEGGEEAKGLLSRNSDLIREIEDLKAEIRGMGGGAAGAGGGERRAKQAGLNLPAEGYSDSGHYLPRLDEDLVDDMWVGPGGKRSPQHRSALEETGEANPQSARTSGAAAAAKERLVKRTEELRRNQRILTAIENKARSISDKPLDLNPHLRPVLSGIGSLPINAGLAAGKAAKDGGSAVLASLPGAAVKAKKLPRALREVGKGLTASDSAVVDYAGGGLRGLHMATRRGFTPEQQALIEMLTDEEINQILKAAGPTEGD